MNIQLKDALNNKLTDALILPANFKDMPTEKEGWNFNWKHLFKQGGMFYKVVLKDEPNQVQGLLKVSVANSEIFFMDNLEVSPENYGINGKYDYVAGVLIAYACKLSFEYGKKNYEGYVVFDSKTVLIDYYKKKYGATFVFGQRMFFLPETGKKLMKQYL